MGFTRLRTILLLSLLACMLFSAPGLHNIKAQTTPLRIMVDDGHSNVIAGLTGLNLTAQKLGATLQYTTSLQTLTIQETRLLIIMSPGVNYTSSDLSALAAFLASGGRIWVAGGGASAQASLHINQLLAGLSSDLRLDQVYLEDPLQNRNSTVQDGLDVILPIINHAYNPVEVRNAAQNVRVIYAYKPIPILAWNGNFTSPQNLPDFQSRWLAASSPASRPSTSNTLTPLFIKNQNSSQEIIVRESLNGGELVAFGSPIFSDLKNMFQYNSTLPSDNAAFSANLLRQNLGLNNAITSEPYITEKTAIKSPKVVLAVGHSLIHNNSTQISTFDHLLKSYGFKTDTTYVIITSSFLSGAQGLVIVSPVTTLSTTEINAIKDWLSAGNRFLWIASSGDDPRGDTNASSTSNLILKELNSTLRFEQGTVYDNSDNIGGQPYLALSSVLNRAAGLASNYTQNIRSLYFYSPTNIAGWKNGNATTLDGHLMDFPTVTWLARTSNSSTVVTLDSTSKLLAYNKTAQRSLILAASEKLSNNSLLLTGSPTFLDYQAMQRYPTLYGYPADNGIFLRDVFLQILQRYTNFTTLQGQATIPSGVEGNPLTLHVQYLVEFLNLETMNTSRFDPVPDATITLTIAGSTVSASKLPNATYLGTATLNSSGMISYNITASALGYFNQTSTGQIKIDPNPQRFSLYVLLIPVAIFIATAVIVTVRKAR